MTRSFARGTVDLDAEKLHLLRAVAERANADEDGQQSGNRWARQPGGKPYPQTIVRMGDAVLVANCYESPGHGDPFATFITQFDPPTVLALLDATKPPHCFFCLRDRIKLVLVDVGLGRKVWMCRRHAKYGPTGGSL